MNQITVVLGVVRVRVELVERKVNQYLDLWMTLESLKLKALEKEFGLVLLAQQV